MYLGHTNAAAKVGVVGGAMYATSWGVYKFGLAPIKLLSLRKNSKEVLLDKLLLLDKKLGKLKMGIKKLWSRTHSLLM